MSHTVLQQCHASAFHVMSHAVLQQCHASAFHVMSHAVLQQCHAILFRCHAVQRITIRQKVLQIKHAR